jgi:hypothetical protein
MAARISLGLNLVLASVLAWILLGMVPAEGGGNVRWLTVAAPAFEKVGYSGHNDGAQACGAYVPPQDPVVGPTQNGENGGDLDNGKGSYLHAVHLPQGAEVTRLTLFINDNDSTDAHLYLVRKRIEGGLSPAKSLKKTMAHTESSGAVNDVMRKFSDSNVNAAVINTQHYSYFLEMVVCGVQEPFAAQVGFRL